MVSTSKAQATKSLYPSEVEKLLHKIREASVDAADVVNKFNIQTNSDKICILTVGNNFARNLEYTLSNLQRITIENHKKDDDNNHLKEAIQEYSTFAHSLQLAFGNNVNKLKFEITNVLKNLANKLNAFLDIVQEHSTYSSKWEIVDILDYLYITIEKVKLRTQWEHLDYNELQMELENNVVKNKLSILDILNDKEDLETNFLRVSHKAVEGILHVLEEIITDRFIALKVTNKISYSIFEYEVALRNKKSMSELILYSKLCATSILGSLKEVLDILNNESLQDSNGNVKNFVMNSVVNGFSCSIRFTRYWERILQN